MRKILRVTKRVFAGALAAVFLLTSIPDSAYAIENDIPIESLELTENPEEVIADASEEIVTEVVNDADETAGSDEQAGDVGTQEAENQEEPDETVETGTEESEGTEALTEDEESEEVDELVEDEESEEVDELVEDEESDKLTEDEEETADIDGEVDALKDGYEVNLTATLSLSSTPVEGGLTVADYQKVNLDPSSGSFKGQLFPDNEGKFYLFVDYTATDAKEGYTFCYKVGESDPVAVDINTTTQAGTAKINIPMVDGKCTSTLSMYVENAADPKECVSEIWEFYLDLFGYTLEMVNLTVEPFEADEVLPDCENEDVVYEKGTKASGIQSDVSFAEGKVFAKLLPVKKDGNKYYYLAGKISSDVEDAKYVVNKEGHTYNPDYDGDDNDTFLIPFVEESIDDLDISVLYNDSEIATYTYDISLGDNVILVPETTLEGRLAPNEYTYEDVEMGEYQGLVQLGTDDYLYGEITYKDGYHLGLDFKSNANITVKLNGEEVPKASTDEEFDFYLVEVSSSSDVITVSAQSEDTYGVEEKKISLSKLKFEQPHNIAVLETVNVNSHATYPVIGAISESLEFVVDGVGKTPISSEGDVNAYDVQIGDKYTVIATAKPGTKIVSYQVDQISETDPNDVIAGKEVAVKNNKLNATGTVQAGYQPHITVKIEDTLELTLWPGDEDTECQKNKDTYVIDQYSSPASPYEYCIEQYSYLLDDIVPMVDIPGGIMDDKIVIMDGDVEILMQIGETEFNYSYAVVDGRIKYLKFIGECFAPDKDYLVKLQRWDDVAEEFYDSQSFKLRFSSEATSVIVKNGKKTVSTINLTAGSYAFYDYTITPATSTGTDIEFNVYHPDGTELTEADWGYLSLNSPEMIDGKFILGADLAKFKAYCEITGVDNVSYILKAGHYNSADGSFTPLKNGKDIRVNITAPKQIEAPTITSGGFDGEYYDAKITLPKSVNPDTTPCYYLLCYEWNKGDGNEPYYNEMQIFPDEITGKFDTEILLEELPAYVKDGELQPAILKVWLYQQEAGQEPEEDTRLSASYADKEFSEYWASSAKDMTVKQVAKTVYTGQQDIVLANVKYSDKVTCNGTPDVIMTLMGMEINLSKEELLPGASLIDYDPVSGDVILKMVPGYAMLYEEVKLLLGKQKLTIKAPSPLNAGNEVSKTISVNIVKGIDSLDLASGNVYASAMESEFSLYKPAGKAASAKLTPIYNPESDIAPKTKKVNYVVYDENGDIPTKVTVKNGKFTIDKSYNIKNPIDGDYFEVYAEAADYEGNYVRSDSFWIRVYSKKPSYEELVLVEYFKKRDGVRFYKRIDSSELVVEDLVDNKNFFITVRPSNIPVKDEYSENELIFAEGNFTIKSSNKKVVPPARGNGYFAPINETIKGVTFTATATDGSKATVKSGKYNIVSSCDRDDFVVETYDEAAGDWHKIEAGSTVMLSGKNSGYIELNIYGLDEDDEMQYNIQLDMTVSVKNGYVGFNDGNGYYGIIPANSKPVTVTVTDKAVKPQIKKVYTFKQRNDVTITAKPDRTINMESTYENVRIDVTFPDGYEPAYYDEENVSATADAASLLYFTYLGKDNTYYNNFINCINDDAIYNWYREDAWQYDGAAFLRKDENGYFADINVSLYGVPLKKGKYSLSCFILDRDGVGEDLSTGAIPLTFEVKQTKVGFNPSAKGTKFTMAFDEKIEWTKTSKTLDKVEFMYCSSQVVDGKANAFAEIFVPDEDGTLIINPDIVSHLKTLSYEECVEMIKEINKNSTGYVEYMASFGNAYKVGVMLVNINVKIPTEAEFEAMK